MWALRHAQYRMHLRFGVNWQSSTIPLHFFLLARFLQNDGNSEDCTPVTQKPTSHHNQFLCLIRSVAFLSSTTFCCLTAEGNWWNNSKTFTGFAPRTSISNVSWNVLPMRAKPTIYTTRRYYLHWCNRTIIWRQCRLDEKAILHGTKWKMRILSVHCIDLQHEYQKLIQRVDSSHSLRTTEHWDIEPVSSTRRLARRVCWLEIIPWSLFIMNGNYGALSVRDSMQIKNLYSLIGMNC